MAAGQVMLSPAEAIEMLSTLKMSQERREELTKELTLAGEVQDYLMSLVPRIESGEEFSMEDVWKQINKIAEKYGHEYGVAAPSLHDTERPLITAKGTPLHIINESNAYSDYRLELIRKGYKVKNSWLRLEDRENFVIEVPDQVKYPEWEDAGDCSDHWEPKRMALWRPMEGYRLRKLVDGILMRAGMPLEPEAEMAAVEKLKGMVNRGQYRSYVLNGALAEHSKKSDLHYIFRKGMPTIVISYHGADTGRVLCCLCLHPVGYYRGTFVGLMTPTDEVIAHLTMMRADEHRYWKESGQWPAHDPRSGL